MTAGYGGEIGVSVLSWNSKATEAVGSYDSGICGTLFLADATGAHALSMTLGAGGNVWNTAAEFNGDEPGGSCGLAFDPAWNPMTNLVTFVADPAGITEGGQQRLDSPLSLYEVSTSFRDPHPILSGLTSVGTTRWSPNGRWLAFVATVDGQSGMWLLKDGSNQPIRVRPSGVGNLAWSPDGRSIAITYMRSRNLSGGVVTETDGISVLDMSTVIGR